MRILSCEPYYGGSHRAFLDHWRDGSRHQWTLLTLPPYKWKWRMRHSAMSFAAEVQSRVAAGEQWDLVFCSDMLNLAEFKGLAGAALGDLPTVAYFHENQLTYPVQVEKERDLHFALTNLTTAVAATEVWFNSDFHRREFLSALPILLKKMPDHQPFAQVEALAERSKIHPQGIAPVPRRKPAARRAGPLRILWAARWEFDKNPQDFFAALEKLQKGGIPFRLSVIGEQFKRVPDVFARAEEMFQQSIDRWGFQENRQEYLAALYEADVFVSTANHEFFGISAVEAIAAGCYALLPDRLAYPEILGYMPPQLRERFLYDGSVQHLAERLSDLATKVEREVDLWPKDFPSARGGIENFFWPALRPRLDRALEFVSEE